MPEKGYKRDHRIDPKSMVRDLTSKPVSIFEVASAVFEEDRLSLHHLTSWRTMSREDFELRFYELSALCGGMERAAEYLLGFSEHPDLLNREIGAEELCGVLMVLRFAPRTCAVRVSRLYQGYSTGRIWEGTTKMPDGRVRELTALIGVLAGLETSLDSALSVLKGAETMTEAGVVDVSGVHDTVRRAGGELRRALETLRERVLNFPALE
jgi:hypothetical protein